MSEKAPLIHVGITVTSIDRFVEFYEKYFGFELKRRGVFPKEFIGGTPELYKLKEGSYSDFAFLESPNGVALELFQFNELLPAEQALWNKPGYHHLCMRVANVPELHKKMAADGVEFYFEPKPMGDSGAFWVFLKDPDGNMIELQDTKG